MVQNCYNCANFRITGVSNAKFFEYICTLFHIESRFIQEL